MASIINSDSGVSSGSAGLKYSADTTGNLVLQTNGNTVATLDTSLNANFTGTVSAVGNVTGGNILTAGLMSSTGTITSSANITGGNILTAGLMSSTGNAIHGNILSAGILSVAGNITSHAILETATITAAAPAATTNFDIVTQAVQYYTTAANANVTLNFRGSSTITANTLLAVGQSTTVALLWTNTGTAYYPNVIQIDSSNVTPKWQGGTAPTGGNANATDVYAFTIIKTAAAPTYTVFASQTKFA